MFQYHELSPELWPALEELFGHNGACGGCWCMWWRVERGGRLWEETKGQRAHKQLKKLVLDGKAQGILAFEKNIPVGWCSFGLRADFPRLNTVKAYRRYDLDKVWCINCFYIKRGYRGQGLARGLCSAAIKAMKKRRVKIIEAYPVTPKKDGGRQAAAFSWTGPEVIFLENGFKEIQRLAPSKPLYRLCLK